VGPSGFDPDAVRTAEVFAREASRSLRLAVRIARLTDAGENLRAAMASRTTIDLAVGIIMAQNGCSQEAAMTILKAASSARNTKLRDIAARVVASAGEDAGGT
jgi:AmiR/NasT family two-component response regulator